MSSRNQRDVDLAEGPVMTATSVITYDAFGRTETVMPWRLCVMHEDARTQLMLHINVFGKESYMSSLNTFFLLGVDYFVNPQLWSIRQLEGDVPYTESSEGSEGFEAKTIGYVAYSKHWPTSATCMSVWISDIGTTSITVVSRIVRTEDNQELSTAVAKVVYIDRTTRGPSPIHDSLREKLSLYMGAEQTLKIPTFQPTASTSLFRYEVKVAPSDIDPNGHMNHSNYVRICCDGAQVAVKAGKLPGYEGDINSYDLKNFQVLYFGEASVGDKLQVLLWQQPDDVEKVYFIVKKEGKDGAIGQVSMTFKYNAPLPSHNL